MNTRQRKNGTATTLREEQTGVICSTSLTDWIWQQGRIIPEQLLRSRWRH